MFALTVFFEEPFLRGILGNFAASFARNANLLTKFNDRTISWDSSDLLAVYTVCSDDTHRLFFYYEIEWFEFSLNLRDNLTGDL